MLMWEWGGRAKGERPSRVPRAACAKPLVRARTLGPRRGAAAPLIAVGLLVLLGAAGLSIDIGLLVVAANECQIIADAATLAGAQELPNYALARQVALSVADRNGSQIEHDLYSVDAETFGEGEAIPDYGEAPLKGALRVSASKQVNYRILRALGREGTTVTRSAVATRRETGIAIVPMWVDYRIEFTYGTALDLHFCDDDWDYQGQYGIFGWVDPLGGVDFDDALAGLLSAEDQELQRVFVGDILYNRPGQVAGKWMHALKTKSYSRLVRAAQSPWATDTFQSFRRDNPRLLMVPLCEYLGGTGNNAHFLVHGFGCFWLEDCSSSGQDKVITGRFVDFAVPGGTCPVFKPSGLVR